MNIGALRCRITGNAGPGSTGNPDLNRRSYSTASFITPDERREFLRRFSYNFVNNYGSRASSASVKSYPRGYPGNPDKSTELYGGYPGNPDKNTELYGEYPGNVSRNNSASVKNYHTGYPGNPEIVSRNNSAGVKSRRNSGIPDAGSEFYPMAYAGNPGIVDSAPDIHMSIRTSRPSIPDFHMEIPDIRPDFRENSSVITRLSRRSGSLASIYSVILNIITYIGKSK